MRNEILRMTRDHFSPEFVNRIDELVLFNRLSRDTMDDILRVRLREVRTLAQIKSFVSSKISSPIPPPYSHPFPDQQPTGGPQDCAGRASGCAADAV